MERGLRKSLCHSEEDRAAKLRAVKRRRQQIKTAVFVEGALSDKREGGSAATAVAAAATHRNFTLFRP